MEMVKSKSIPEASTSETMATLSDLPLMLAGAHDSNVYESNEIDEYERFWDLGRSSDEGRRCDITYTDCYDDVLSDPFRSGLHDPLLGELHPESLDPKKCSIPRGLNQNTIRNEVGKAKKRVWKFGTRSSGDEEEIKVLFCNRLLKMVKVKQDEEEDLEVRLLAEASIMTQIAQHADQAQELFRPRLKVFGRQASAVSRFGGKVSAPVVDLNFDHGSGRQVTSPFPTHSKSPTSKHRPVDLPVPDQDVQMDEVEESPGEGGKQKEGLDVPAGCCKKGWPP